MKAGVPIAAVLALLGCGGPPRLVPAAPQARDETLGRCLGVFPAPDFRAVHSISATLPGGVTGVFLGVSATSDGGRSFRGNLLSLEGMVLVDVEWSPAGLVVHRALPPLDREGFAAGMAADMRLLLLAPAGPPREIGEDGDGRAVCRWVREDGATQDIAIAADGEGWATTVWDAGGRKSRQVRGSGPMRDGFASRMELTASGESAYSLVLELVDVEAVGAGAGEMISAPPAPAGGCLDTPPRGPLYAIGASGREGGAHGETMDRETAFETVRRYLTKQFELPPEKVTAEAHLFEELALDSIDALDMISLMETELGMAVVEEELKTIRTVEDVVQYLVRHAPQKK
ncbi:MAG: hypothetical protein HY905_11010 [Deltaproteobacteria bacterium]|nr:hypothetical protein [Deltaproteobacteria bacterium]